MSSEWWVVSEKYKEGVPKGTLFAFSVTSVGGAPTERKAVAVRFGHKADPESGRCVTDHGALAQIIVFRQPLHVFSACLILCFYLAMLIDNFAAQRIAADPRKGLAIKKTRHYPELKNPPLKTYHSPLFWQQYCIGPIYQS
ncbi:MAG: hypothetical protein ACO1O1_08780 [Adhaeribacter sp.]